MSGTSRNCTFPCFLTFIKVGGRGDGVLRVSIHCVASFLFNFLYALFAIASLMHDKCLGTFLFSSSFFPSSVSLKKKIVLLILYACSRVSLLFSSYRFIRCIFLFFSLLVLFMLIACLMTPSRPTHLLTFNFYFSFCFSDTCCKCFPNGLRFTHGQLR